MHRYRIQPACVVLALAFLLACGGPRPADVPLQHGEDPWTHGLEGTGADQRHQLCAIYRSFIGVGDLPGLEFSSGAGSVSRDGQRVVGKSNLETGVGEGFTWTRPGSGLKFWPSSSGDGIQPLGFYASPGGQPGNESEAAQVSADGTVVVGAGKSADSVWHAVKWTQSGIELIPEPSAPWAGRSEAYGVSGDGAVITGMGTTASTELGFRWTAAGGTELLTQPPAGSTLDRSWANGVSDDGKTIVGRMNIDGNPLYQACAWRSSTPGGALTPSLLSSLYSEAFSVSADGSVAVGYIYTEACCWRWNEIAGEWGPPQFLGTLVGTVGSMALDVDAEGRVVVGYSFNYGDFDDPADDVERGTVWLLDGLICPSGPQDASTLLSSVGLTAHAGWSLESIGGVTIDPTSRVIVLVGGGENPAHQPEGWVAHVPPWCLTPCPSRIEPNVPYLWPIPIRTFRGGPINPLGHQ
jgi:uncharacterized membrane protein